MPTKSFSEMQIGDVRVLRCYDECVACGARYRARYKKVGPEVRDMVCVSNHKCDPERLAKREEELKHEWDDPEQYCDCDELDCKFEFLEQMRNEMQ